MEIEKNSRPRRGREALNHIVAKLLRGEVTVLEERASLDLNVADRTELLDQGTEGMEGRDRLSGTSMR